MRDVVRRDTEVAEVEEDAVARTPWRRTNGQKKKMTHIWKTLYNSV